MKEKDIIKFIFENETHLITIGAIESGKLKITIASNPINTDLELDQSRKFDLNGDTHLDLEVTLNSLASTSSATSELGVKLLEQPVPEVRPTLNITDTILDVPPVQDTNVTVTGEVGPSFLGKVIEKLNIGKLNNPTLIGVGLIVAILVLGLLFYFVIAKLFA